MPVPVKCLLPPDSYACRNGTRHSHPAIERRSAFGSSPSRKAPQDHEADTIRGQAERLCSPIRGWVPLPCLSLSVLCVDWSDGTVGSTHTARGERKQPEAALQRSSRAAMGSMLRSRLRKIAPGVVKTAVDLEMVKRVRAAHRALHRRPAPPSRSSSRMCAFYAPNIVTQCAHYKHQARFESLCAGHGHVRPHPAQLSVGSRFPGDAEGAESAVAVSGRKPRGSHPGGPRVGGREPGTHVQCMPAGPAAPNNCPIDGPHRRESTVTVEYEHGERLQYKTDKIETPALLKAFREDSNMAAIRGYLQKAGLRLEDWGKPGDAAVAGREGPGWRGSGQGWQCQQSGVRQRLQASRGCGCRRRCGTIRRLRWLSRGAPKTTVGLRRTAGSADARSFS